jgi:hypothetical protein
MSLDNDAAFSRCFYNNYLATQQLFKTSAAKKQILIEDLSTDGNISVGVDRNSRGACVDR